MTYVELAAGYKHSVGRRSDGTVVAWGDNSKGQCNVPTLPSGLTYVGVTAGGGPDGAGHTLACRSDGSVVAWGDNSFGQCNVPTPPSGLTYLEVAAGAVHSLARLSNGSVVTWGDGQGYQYFLPPLPPGYTCVRIDAGGYVSLALLENSSVTTFCTSKSGLVCGPAQISASGVPSVSASSGFVVSAAPARNNKPGLLVYNTTQVAALPFHGGTLCVEPMALRRAGSTNSGAGCGPRNCSGVMSIDMNAFAQGDTGLCSPNPCWVVPDCNGAPSGIATNKAAQFLLVPGTVIFAQYWGRDSVATGSLVSNGITYTSGL